MLLLRYLTITVLMSTLRNPSKVFVLQDGSFGSRTNPKPGGEASDWVKKNAKSGAARNEEYYGKIEDDNRKNHVEFRKKYPSLFPKVGSTLDNK